MRITHAADLHLGYRQYGLRAREEDFFQAFEATVTEMLLRETDIIVFAGDIFDKRVIRPETRSCIVEVLGIAQQKDVSVLAVHGNHDRAMFSEEETWLLSLEGDGLLVVLGDVEPNEIRYMHKDGVAFAGLGYQGFQEREALNQLGAYLSNFTQPVILVCHIGTQGTMGDNVPGGMTPDELKQMLPNNVIAVLTGHFHQQWTDGFVFQPGPLSPCAMGQEPGGFYQLDIGTDSSVGWEFVPVSSYHTSRHFETIRVASLADLELGPQHESAVLSVVFTKEMPSRAQVELALSVEPLKLLVSYAADQGDAFEGTDSMIPAEVERGVLSSLLDDDLVPLAVALKEMALAKEPAESIVTFLEKTCG